MPTERERMVAGELYDPLDPALVAGRTRARDLCWALNATRESEDDARRDILRQMFATGGDSVWMQPPFFCDYGSNIELGQRVFFNFNCVVLDVCPRAHRQLHAVRSCRTDLHGDAPARRRTAPAPGVRKTVDIGSDVWVGGGAIILSGVRIGSRAVIGAGSVVTRDVPDDVFAAGNPCRVIRELER